MLAACLLQGLLDSRDGELDLLNMRVELNRIIEIVRAFVPSERWPEIQAAVRGDAPVRASETNCVEGIEMVEIDNGSDEDDY
jgi:hypothetical protein